MGMAIRVLLADDHQIVREGLRSMLSRVEDIDVVGEAENGREAISKARELRPDVIVMDVGMRDLNGVDATRQVLAEVPGVHVVALSMHSDRRFISEMLKAGASGYVLKDSAFDELTGAVRMAASGRVYLAEGIADVVVSDYVRRLSTPSEAIAATSGKALSPREREVLQLTAEGCSTKEIAARLHLSVKTVETHRRQIMDKLGIYNLAGLIKHAVREGLASLDD